MGLSQVDLEVLLSPLKSATVLVCPSLASMATAYRLESSLKTGPIIHLINF